MKTNRFAVCAVVLLCAGHAYGQDAEKAEPGPFDLRLTGDWGGLRADLADKGISLRPTYHQHFQANLDGGRDFSGSLDLDIELDLGRMGVIDGGTFFIRGKSTWSDGINGDYVGSMFGVNDNASGNHEIFVTEWWYRHRWDDRTELFLGRLDTSSSNGPASFLDDNAYASSANDQFVSPALTRNMAVPHSEGLGAMVRFWPAENLYISLAAVDAGSRPRRTGFDTAFHGRTSFRAFLEGGVTTALRSAKGPMPGHHRAGIWYDGGSKAVIDRPGRSQSGDVGFYLGLDQMVWKENDDPHDTQGLGVFGRYGYAPGDTNAVEHFWSAGLQYRGLFEGRDDDVLGLGVAQGIMSDEYRTWMSPLADRETVYELYYSWKATPWMTISPNVQYISQPGGREGDEDALVVGVRAKIGF